MDKLTRPTTLIYIIRRYALFHVHTFRPTPLHDGFGSPTTVVLPLMDFSHAGHAYVTV